MVPILLMTQRVITRSSPVRNDLCLKTIMLQRVECVLFKDVFQRWYVYEVRAISLVIFKFCENLIDEVMLVMLSCLCPYDIM